MAIAFVNLRDPKAPGFKASAALVDGPLKELAKKYYRAMVIAYADTLDYQKHRKLLGVTHSRVPALSINHNEQKVMPYPENDTLTVEAINSWLMRFVKGELTEKS